MNNLNQTVNNRKQTANDGNQTVNNRQQTAYDRVQTANNRRQWAQAALDSVRNIGSKKGVAQKGSYQRKCSLWDADRRGVRFSEKDRQRRPVSSRREGPERSDSLPLRRGSQRLSHIQTPASSQRTGGLKQGKVLRFGSSCTYMIVVELVSAQSY